MIYGTCYDACFKSIELYDDDVLIHHYIYDEYDFKDLKGEINFTDFKENILRSYRICETLEYCKIIHDDMFLTTIKMPKFITFNKDNKIDKDYAKNIFIHKFEKLILEMFNKQIIHLDFCLGNIGIDENGDYKFLNLMEVYTCNDVNDFLQWYRDIKNNFNFYNLEKRLDKIEDKIKINQYVSIH